MLPARLPLVVLCLVATLSAAHATPAPVPDTEPAARPRLTAGPDGGVVLSWVAPKGKEQALVYSRSDGSSWSEPVTVYRGRDLVASWADPPTVMRTRNGWFALWLAPAAKKSHGTFVMLARSSDGETWSRPERVHEDTSDTEHGFASLLPGPDGVEVAWLDGRAYATGGSATALRIRTVAPELGPERVLDDRTCDCCPTAGLGDLLVYRDRIGGEIRDMSLARRASGWTPERATHDDWEFAGCPVSGPAVAVNQRELLVWFNPDAVAQVQAVPLGSGWPRTPVVLDAGDGVLGRVGVAAFGAGWLVTWSRETDGDRAQILARTIGPDGALGPVQVVGEAGASRSAGAPTIAAVDGGVLIVWQDGDPATLRAARLAPE